MGREILDFFRHLLGTESWPARWKCGLWTDFHGWLYIFSDVAIGMAYFAIPLIILGFTSRKTTPLFKKIFYLFSAFIFACGLTHLIDALMFWYPVYRLSAFARFITAVISWVTIIALFRYIPKIMALKSSEELEREIMQRMKTESELKQIKSSLEEEVHTRTSNLKEVNQRLKTEIIERTAKEIQIRESEERFRSLVESSPNAIVLTDDQGVIRLINRQTENLFGYERNELIGKPIEVLLPERFRKNHVSYRDEFYADPNARPMGVGRDLYAVHKDGHETAVEIGLTPLRSEDMLMVLATVVDITERKKNEENLIQKNAELAKFNEELKSRTAQLIQSEKMSALGTLIAGVAHELNNPITGILNYAQYCKKSLPQEGKVTEVLDDLVFEAKRCAEIVKNLLIYAYFSSDDENSTGETSRVSEVTKRVSNLFAHLLKSVKVMIEIPEDLPEFRIPMNKLQQVISNIVKNSLDAMENKENKKISIQAFQDSDSCHLIIEDTGVGISKQNLSKIFDPFYTTKEVGKGTGLGLSVCKSIIEEYKGEIYVDSIPDHGTKFHVILPKEKLS
jgi:PAS domain S-box-containing protein